MIGAQVPDDWTVRLKWHPMQRPVHAESQQTPSTQKPLVQPLASWQAPPRSATAKQEAPMQTRSPPQSASTAQAAQTVGAPLQRWLAHSASPAQLSPAASAQVPRP